MDFATESVNDGKFVSMPSLDIDGAFDTVSRGLLIETLEAHQVNRYVIRSIVTWLLNRVFRIKLKTGAGAFFSRQCPVSRGALQGGVLSPVLRILFSR